MLKVSLVTLFVLAPATVVASATILGDASKPQAMISAASLQEGGKRGLDTGKDNEDPDVIELAKIFRKLCYPAGGERCCSIAFRQCVNRSGDTILCDELRKSCVTGGFVSGN